MQVKDLKLQTHQNGETITELEARITNQNHTIAKDREKLNLMENDIEENESNSKELKRKDRELLAKRNQLDADLHRKTIQV